MTAALWLPTALRRSGYPVVEVDGWQTRGHDGAFDPVGVMAHHTATSARADGDYPSLGTVRDGRPDLAGPLSQVGVGRNGTWYVIAAGRCWHAGVGTWKGLTEGNGRFVGVEAENPGDGSPWPAVQIDSYHHGVAEMLREMQHDASWCCGHKEYARPLGRKPDPNFSMTDFRDAVYRLLHVGPAPAHPAAPDGNVPAFPLPAGHFFFLPRADPKVHSGYTADDRNRLWHWQTRMARRGWKVNVDGRFTDTTLAVMRAFQAEKHVSGESVLGPRTWAAAWTAQVS